MDLITVTSRAGGEGVAIRVRDHGATWDLARADGGRDCGPSPSEMLVASLGACIVLMVGAYLRRKGYGDGLAASMTYEMARGPARIAAVVVDLEIPPGVPEAEHAVIRRIAEACPIHATLHGAVRIDLDLVSAP